MDLNELGLDRVAPRPKRGFDWKQLGMLVIAGAVGGALTLSGWLWLAPDAAPPDVNMAPEGTTDQPNNDAVTDGGASVETAVQKILPAVVAIVSEAQVRNIFGRLYTQTGGGSGFIVRSDGLIVTNKHVVVSQTATYTVEMASGKKYSAQVVARDPVVDLALVKINASGLTAATLGDSNKLKLGQRVIAIGNALGEYQNTVTTGVISGLNRSITASNGLGSSEKLTDVIQTDAAINPGNSGGPLINLNGEVVGINTAIDAQGQSVGFAIPINDVKPQIQTVSAGGTISRPQLGVRYILLDAALASANDLSVSEGAYITPGAGANDAAVSPGGPADLAGLKEGDIIVSVNGEKVTPANDLGTVIQKYRPGDAVSVKFIRQGQIKTVTVRLGSLS